MGESIPGGVRRSSLRAVGPEDVAPARAKTVSEAASSGSQLALLIALRERVAIAVQNPNCPPRDLAALSRRLQEIAREIEAINAASDDDDISAAAGTPDEAWDGAAI